MACEPHKNPLQRSGTSQADRLLPGLSPTWVRIDEREYADWIVFASEYSKYLRFHDATSGTVHKGWQAFFDKDVSAILGNFAVQDIEGWRLGVRERLDFLRDDDNAGDLVGLRKNLGEVFGAAATLAKALDDFHLRLPEQSPFKAALRRFIKPRLAPAFRRLLGYHKAAVALGLATPVAPVTPVTEAAAWRILGRPLADAGAILLDPEAFTSEWWIPGDPQQASYALLPEDASIFGDPGSVFARISHGANHFLFSSVFDLFTEAFARLIGEAETSLVASLEADDGHKPHYALFLTFLKLFRETQARMNGLLWRHLDFYYKDILRLRPKGAEPDHVHLVAELAKAVPMASLPAGALFKAGKDSLGKDVFYALDEETTFNKAMAASFKAIYRVDAADVWEDPVLEASKRYFASPMMDSEDGLGAELLSAFKEWHPFLSRSAAPDGANTAIHMPPARIGFAVASHYLFLAEGFRVIKLRFGGTLFSTYGKENLTFLLTHEKGWLEIAATTIRATTFTGGAACTEIEIRLAGTDPALTAWNAKAHGGEFNVDVPVVQCLLRNEPGRVHGLDDLKDAVVTAVEVAVQVGATTGSYSDTGAKQVLLANGGGGLDPSKPFQPWGPIPERDMPLILGLKEAFTKKGATFNLHLAWDNRTITVTPNPGARLQFLQGGAWKDASAAFTGEVACSSSRQVTFTNDIAIPESALADYRNPYPAYAPTSRSGFLRLVLNGNFGQEAYQEALTAYLIAQAAGAANPAVKPGDVANYAAGIVKDILDGMGAFVEKVYETGTAVVEDAVETGSEVAEVIVEAGTNMAEEGKDFLEDPEGALDEFAENAPSVPPPGSGSGPINVGPQFSMAAGSGTASGQNIQGMIMAPSGIMPSPIMDSILAGKAGYATSIKAKTPVKPYLPVIGALYLSYKAASGAVELVSGDADDLAARPVRLFHLGPFGEAEQEFPIHGATSHTLLPRFRTGSGPDHIGEFLIGFTHLGPRQSVEVLIQVLEGSSDPTLSKPDNHVAWHYWNGQTWVLFEERDFSDGTKQLIQSGIVRFTIPADATTDKGILPKGYLWVMAAVTQDVGAVCKVLSVKAQACKATLVLPGVAPDYLDKPLPAATISKLKVPDPGFKKFEQLHPSFGGRQTETSGRFYLRSSERLRHKGRAATIWDYETLVLEAFPGIFKVKCLNHTRIEDHPDSSLAIHNENAPGHVALITIPTLHERSDANPLKPYASLDLLEGIKDFLKARVTGQLVPGPTAPYQVNVHVCNPLFEEIRLEFHLQLKDGFEDFSWYRQVLQDEITRHLSPWAFRDGRSDSSQPDVQFGGRISKSALINFIEERPYVDFVTEVTLKHKPGNAPMSGDLEEAVATTSRSILVSAPAADHAIHPYGSAP